MINNDTVVFEVHMG